VQALHRPYVPSAKELQRGIDDAPLVMGLLQFGKNYSKGENVALLCQECEGRYQNPRQAPVLIGKACVIAREKINVLKALIKQDVKERDPHADLRYFKPLFTPFDDYKFDLVTKL
jgi:hypothetical protein